MLLYAVTDRAWVGKQSLSEQVESALKGGAGVDGAALVSAVFAAEYIESECRILRSLSEK